MPNFGLNSITITGSKPRTRHLKSVKLRQVGPAAGAKRRWRRRANPHDAKQSLKLLEGSHFSVERRRRRLGVVTRTERLLFHGVQAVRQCLKEASVLCGKAVGELGNLHLALR
jgi:hypothetical protein